MSEVRGGEAPQIESATLGWAGTIELIEMLIHELQEFSFSREKILEKLDLRAARRARETVRSLERFARALLHDDASADCSEGVLCDLLAASHELLTGNIELVESAPPPAPDSSVVSLPTRSRTPTKSYPVPIVAPLYHEEEPTLPGHRAALKSIALLTLSEDLDDEENETTRAGLPGHVMESYLREVRRTG